MIYLGFSPSLSLALSLSLSIYLSIYFSEPECYSQLWKTNDLTCARSASVNILKQTKCSKLDISHNRSQVFFGNYANKSAQQSLHFHCTNMCWPKGTLNFEVETEKPC